MPLSVVHDHESRWIRVRASGCITIDDMVNLIRTVRAQVAHRMTPMLFDATGATTDATDDDVRRAVDAVRQAIVRGGRRGHVALVADDDTFYERLLSYETACVDADVRVIRAFRLVADAERWLQIVSAARHFH